MSNSTGDAQAGTPSIPPNISLLTGPVFYGIIFNWCLLGSVLVQSYYYFVSFPTDRAVFKMLVSVMLILDLLQTAFTTHYVHGSLVSGWGNLASLSAFPWSGTTISILTGLVSLLAQLFFAWRIWTLAAGRKLMTAVSILVVMLALMQSISAMIGAIKFALLPGHDVTEFATYRIVVVSVNLWLGGSFAVDVVIATTMLAYLIPMHRQSTWKRTEALVTRLIIHTVESGVVTMVAAGIDLLLYLHYPNLPLHETPALILGKIYTNVVLANLNARNREKDYTSSGRTFFESFSLPIRGQPNRQIQSSNPKPFVSVSTTVIADTDTGLGSMHGKSDYEIGAV